jgi:lysozyme family protein
MNEIAFSKALAFTLREEGGFVDNAHDHGGRTNHGITQAAYDEWRVKQGLGFADVAVIQGEEVARFYSDIWIGAHCDDMSLGLATCHFDWSVNHGIGRYHVAGSLETLQETLQVEVDGVYGAKTRAALLALDHDDLWKEYETLRREWYQARVKSHPDQAVFIHGWLGRCDRLDAYVDNL